MEGSPETKSPSSCLKCTVLELIRTREGPDIYYLSFKPTIQNTFDFQILWFCYKDMQQRLIRTSKRFAHRLLHVGIERKKYATKNTAIENKSNNKSKEILVINKHFSYHYFVYCFVLIAVIRAKI